MPASTLLRDVAEMRRSVGADAARLCAERANETQLARVLAMAHGYPDRPVGVAELTAADISFWDAVVDGSGNIAYRLALNTLRQGFLAIGVEHLVGLLEEYSDRDAHIALAAIIARRDGAAAHDRATALLGTFTSAVATADGAP
ncbi:FCD domain-containing protein [Rhodococcus triatomae]|uniref:FCD domain-containing protein n=2 Tax=Rhodococcus triatomae TaxID=300028 RepID=A0A1G8I5R9_9NOCA|nr:FCD domain-containing protein [Rhodococcus triatomae]